MTDRNGALLAAKILANVRASKLTQRARRKAARCVWAACDGFDFTGWDVLDSGELTDGGARGLGLMKGPTAGETLLDMATLERPEPKKSAVLKLAERVAKARCGNCGQPWGEHTDRRAANCTTVLNKDAQDGGR